MNQTNIINFPIQNTQHADEETRRIPSDVLRIDLLSIANYLQYTSDKTDRPLWMEAMANEVRSFASEIGGDH